MTSSDGESDDGRCDMLSEDVFDDVPYDSGKQVKIEAFLYESSLEDGYSYWKSRHIADELGMDTTFVGVVIPTLDEKSPRLSIEKWAHTDATTWRVDVV